MQITIFLTTNIMVYAIIMIGPLIISIKHEQQLSLGQQTVQELRQWFNSHQVPYTESQIGNSQHLRSQPLGFEIELKNNRLNTFFAYIRTPKFQEFAGVLPFGINGSWNLRVALMYLGQPPVKSTKVVEIVYDHLGVGLVFKGRWSDLELPVDYVYLYAPQGIFACGGCGKKGEVKKLSCCNFIGYCSQDCQEKHQGMHSIFCGGVD